MNSGPYRLPVSVRKVSFIFSMPFIFSLKVRCRLPAACSCAVDHEPERRREVLRPPPELVGVIERIAHQPPRRIVPVKGLLKRLMVPDGIRNVLPLPQVHAQRRSGSFPLRCFPRTAWSCSLRLMSCSSPAMIAAVKRRSASSTRPMPISAGLDQDDRSRIACHGLAVAETVGAFQQRLIEIGPALPDQLMARRSASSERRSREACFS